MKIGIIQGTTQANKNTMLYECTKRAVAKYRHEVINFGVTAQETESYSYTEIAVLIAWLINSKTVDFIITGCSSGQGMNLACNTLPGVLSGLIQTPQDAFLYGRINGGNVASFSLGLGFGWLGELNFEYAVDKLFAGELGVGYPPETAVRKRREAQMVKTLNQIGKRSLTELMDDLAPEFRNKVLSKKDVVRYIMENSKEESLVKYLANYGK